MSFVLDRHKQSQKPTPDQWKAWKAQQKEGWSYRTKVIQQFGITEYQFTRGVNDGVIITQMVENPFRPGTSATMVLVSSVRNNLHYLNKLPTDRFHEYSPKSQNHEFKDVEELV